MKKKKLKNRIVEIYQIVSELCGYGLSQINNTKPVYEINKLMKPMEEHDLKAYKKNPFNMTDWDSYSKKLEEFIDELKHIGDK